MEIWESEKDWGAIMRKIIIVIEILAIILLIAAIPEEQAKGVNEVIQVEKEETKYFIMKATAYYPGEECTWPFNDGLTATGEEAGKGCIAIDPNAGILKLGQKVYVEGYGTGICNDVGAAIKGWEIDLCFDTLQEAREYGIKLAKVYILE